MGFDSAAIMAAAQSLKLPKYSQSLFAPLGKIIYLPDGEEESFDQFITWACQHMDYNDEGVGRAVAAERTINVASSFYKHETFEDEAEWRVSLFANSAFNNPLQTEFRVGRSTLIPFTRINFENATMEFIKEIIVGPTPNMSLSIEAVEKFVQISNVGLVKVAESKVPYRHW